MKKESNSDEKNILKSETNEYMIDWWVGTVILTFFPILTSIIINICRNGYADFNRMVGDGELILSAFLVITPSHCICRLPGQATVFPHSPALG